MASYIFSDKKPAGDMPNRVDVGGKVNKDARKKGREAEGQRIQRAGWRLYTAWSSFLVQRGAVAAGMEWGQGRLGRA